MRASDVATEVMFEVAKIQSKYWKSIDVKACEPPETTDTGIETRTSIAGESCFVKLGADADTYRPAQSPQGASHVYQA